MVIQEREKKGEEVEEVWLSEEERKLNKTGKGGIFFWSEEDYESEVSPVDFAFPHSFTRPQLNHSSVGIH